MFLKTIYDELKDYQLSYNGNNTIYELLDIDTEKKEGRMNLIIQILRYGKSLNMNTFKENKIVLDMKEVKKRLTECKTFNKNLLIVSSKLKHIAEDLSYEIMKENEHEFDFSLIKKIVNKEVDVNDFFKTGSKKVFLLIGKDGKEYYGTNTNDLFKFKEKEIRNILEGYIGTDERVSLAIEKLINTEKSEVNKQFKSFRVAGLSIINNIVMGVESSVINKLLEEL